MSGIVINIVKDKDGVVEEKKNITTSSYFLAYMEGSQVRFDGNFDIKSLGPLLPSILNFITTKMTATSESQ